MGEDVLKFECTHCGKCCVDLWVPAGPKVDDAIPYTGLGIDGNELFLFNRQTIVPGSAYFRPVDGGLELLAIQSWQMRLRTCPHHSDKGCDMYTHRPKLCIGYPCTVDPSRLGEYVVTGKPVPGLFVLEKGCTWARQSYESGKNLQNIPMALWDLGLREAISNIEWLNNYLGHNILTDPRSDNPLLTGKLIGGFFDVSASRWIIYHPTDSGRPADATKFVQTDWRPFLDDYISSIKLEAPK